MKYIGKDSIRFAGYLRKSGYHKWPPKSGRKQQFSEIDRGEFFDLQTARCKINQAQVDRIDRLLEKLK
jgi:predicted NUDIX family NTP pyrophosphohydrolase